MTEPIRQARENDPSNAKAGNQGKKYGAVHDGLDLIGNRGQSAAARAKPAAGVQHPVGKW